MSKMGAYQPPEKFKNYSLPTSKPFKSNTFYKEKVVTLQEQLFKKLKKVAEFLESLYPKLTDEFSRDIQVVIKKNLETLIEDLDLMQVGLHKNPYTFNTKKLKTNQHCITEMKKVCDTLQTVKSYDEFKKLAKIKHALNELEHLIQPTSIERNLEKAGAKSKPKKVPVKKEPVLVEAKKKKAISKIAKPTTKLLKPIKKVSKQPQESEAPVKQSEKKVTKPKSKPKLPAEHKKVLAAKPKSKIKSPAEKTKSLAKPKKELAAKSKPKIKSSAAQKKKLPH